MTTKSCRAALSLVAGSLGLAALLLLVSQAQSGRRVPYAPTAADQLPDAVLGKASAPLGAPVAYYFADPRTRGYLAAPQKEGKHPAIILVHEWNGLVDRIRQMADALAAEGYVALAADLFSGRTGSNPQENMALVRETMAKPEVIIANLNAAADFLQQRPDVTGKIGTIGWCYGGGVVLSYALGGHHHDATAIFYGRLVDDPDQLKKIRHEMFGTFARLDRGPSPEQVESFVAALRKAGVKNDVHIYDDVNHGFWLYVEQDPATRQKPALDAWKRLKEYFQRTLGS